MTNFMNGRCSVSRLWQLVLGTIPALFLGACAEETSAPPADPPVTVTARIIHSQTGEVREVTGRVAMSVLEGATDDTAAEKAGCTHIRFCTTTFFDGIFNEPNTVVCDTNDQGCSSSSRFSECNSDARFVCGKTRPMGFDPPIPCPLAGVSTSLCPAGWNLVWLLDSSGNFGTSRNF